MINKHFNDLQLSLPIAATFQFMCGNQVRGTSEMRQKGGKKIRLVVLEKETSE